MGIVILFVVIFLLWVMGLVLGIYKGELFFSICLIFVLSKFVLCWFSFGKVEVGRFLLVKFLL